MLCSSHPKYDICILHRINIFYWCFESSVSLILAVVKAACISSVTGCALVKSLISENCKINKIKKTEPWSNRKNKELFSKCLDSPLIMMGTVWCHSWVIMCGVMRRRTMEKTMNKHLKPEGFGEYEQNLQGSLLWEAQDKEGSSS